MSFYNTRLRSLARSTAEPRYYEQGWRDFLESHLFYIRQREDTIPVQIEEYDRYKYEGDFFGLLQTKSVPEEFHWVILRVNDMSSPSELTMDTSMFYFPDLQHIRELMTLYRSQTKKLA